MPTRSNSTRSICSRVRQIVQLCRSPFASATRTSKDEKHNGANMVAVVRTRGGQLGRRRDDAVAPYRGLGGTAISAVAHRRAAGAAGQEDIGQRWPSPNRNSDRTRRRVIDPTAAFRRRRVRDQRREDLCLPVFPRHPSWSGPRWTNRAGRPAVKSFIVPREHRAVRTTNTNSASRVLILR